jgi:phenylacetate-CoA ligase
MSRLLWTIANSFSPEYRRFKRSIDKYIHLTPEQAAAQTRRRLYQYLVYCRTYSPYWRDRWPKEAARFSPDEAEDVLALLPPLTKTELREYSEQLHIAPEVRKPGDGYPAIRKQRTLKSGGSTGVPVVVYIDDTYSDRNRATYDFFYNLCGLPPGEPFFFIWGSPNELTDMKTSWKKQISSWLRGIHPMPAFGLSPQKIYEMRDEIRRRQHVRSAMCFTSAAETIANLAQLEGLEFRQLERVFTGGGLLHERLRELLQKHLAPEVFNTYASRDFGMMAHETPAHDGLSIADWFNKVEVLNPTKQRVAAGEKGEVHVTAINNYSCALIRMAMGDTARWYPDSGKNPIPTPRLTELTGRTVEHLSGPNGIVIDPSAVIHLVGVVIAPPWLRKFQLVQRSPAEYELRVEAWERKVSEQQVSELRSRLRAELSNLVRESVELAVVVVDEIPPLPSGKHQYCLKQF